MTNKMFMQAPRKRIMVTGIFSSFLIPLYYNYLYSIYTDAVLLTLHIQNTINFIENTLSKTEDKVRRYLEGSPEVSGHCSFHCFIQDGKLSLESLQGGSYPF